MTLDDKTKRLLSAYYDGEVSAQEKDLAERLIGDNKDCRTYYESLHSLSSSLDSWSDENLSPDLEQRIEKGLREARLDEEESMEEREFESVSVYRRPAFVFAGSGLVVTVICFVVIGQLYFGGPKQQIAKLNREVRSSEVGPAIRSASQVHGQLAYTYRGKEEDSDISWNEVASIDEINRAPEENKMLESPKPAAKSSSRMFKAGRAAPMKKMADLKDVPGRDGKYPVAKTKQKKHELKEADAVLKSEVVRGGVAVQGAQPEIGAQLEYEPYYLESSYDAQGAAASFADAVEQEAPSESQVAQARSPQAVSAKTIPVDKNIVAQGALTSRTRAAGGFYTLRNDVAANAIEAKRRIYSPARLKITSEVLPSQDHLERRRIRIHIAGKNRSDRTLTLGTKIAQNVRLMIALNPDFIKAHRLIFKGADSEFLSDTFSFQYDVADDIGVDESKTITLEIILQDKEITPPHPESFRYSGALEYQYSVVLVTLHYTHFLRGDKETITYSIDSKLLLPK